MDRKDRNPTTNLDKAIELYKQTLSVVRKDNAEWEWANLIYRLGVLYQMRSQEKPNQDQKNALSCFQDALTVFNKDNDPLSWAYAHFGCAGSLYILNEGNRSENLIMSLKHIKQSLNIFKEDTHPDIISTIWKNIAEIYQELVTGIYDNDTEGSIDYMNRWIDLFDKETFPREWALNNIFLGELFANRKGEKSPDERSEYIEKAISCLQRSLTILKKENMPQALARSSFRLSFLFRDRIAGDPFDNLEKAIKNCEESLLYYTLKKAPDKWALLMRNLSFAYKALSTKYPVLNHEKAIDCFEQLLHFSEENSTAKKDILFYLSELCTLLDTPVTSEKAIKYYKKFLAYINKKRGDKTYASASHNLANLYLNRKNGNPLDNMEKAIDYYEQALTVLKIEANPIEWATTMQYLSIAYAERLKGNPSENQETAISLMEQALKVFDIDQTSTEWVGAINNLGVLYNNRIVGIQMENVEKAIECYRKALNIESDAITKLNLGNALTMLCKGRVNKNEIQEEAIHCLNDALKALNQKDDHEDWSNAMINLGIVYLEREKGVLSKNQQKALDCFKQTLSIIKKETNPKKWATIMMELGNAHSHVKHLGDPERDLRNLITTESYYLQAKGIIEESADLRLRIAFFTNFGDSLLDLGKLKCDDYQIQTGLIYLKDSISMIEQTRMFAIDEHSRKDLIRRYIRTYHSLIEHFLEKSDYTNAFYWMEKSRSRTLLESIDLEAIKPNRKEAQRKVRDYWELCTRIRHFQRGISGEAEMFRLVTNSFEQQRTVTLKADVTQIKDDSDEATKLEQQRQSCLAEIKEIDPDYVKMITGEPVRSEILLGMLQTQEAASLSFLIKDELIHCLVSYAESGILKYHLEKLSSSQIIKMTIGWLNHYSEKPAYRDPMRMFNSLDQLLVATGELIQPIIDFLNEKGIQRIFLSPHGILHLLPFHAAKLPKTGDYLIESGFEISYVPSITQLALIYKDNRKALNLGPIVGLYCSPEGPDYLFFGEKEVDQLQDIYKNAEVIPPLKHQEATLEQLKKTLNKNPQMTQLVFSCHGKSDLNNPSLAHLYLSDGTSAAKPYRCGGKPAFRQDLIDTIQGSNIGLVILSACESGQGVEGMQGYDEYVGLDSVFMQMAVPSIISTLYSVNDQSTSDIMGLFHTQVAKGLSPSQALHSAQLQFIKNHNSVLSKGTKGIEIIDENAKPKSYGHPYYWAFLKYSGKF